MNKIKAKEILEARYRGLSLNEITKTLHASKIVSIIFRKFISRSLVSC